MRDSQLVGLEESNCSGVLKEDNPMTQCVRVRGNTPQRITLYTEVSVNDIFISSGVRLLCAKTCHSW